MSILILLLILTLMLMLMLLMMFILNQYLQEFMNDLNMPKNQKPYIRQVNCITQIKEKKC